MITQITPREVLAYITNTDVFAAHLGELVTKLNAFYITIHRNLGLFVEMLERWEPEGEALKLYDTGILKY